MASGSHGIGDDTTAATAAMALNVGCFCISRDEDALAHALATISGDSDFYARHIVPRAHLLASVPVFLPQAELDRMLDVVTAIERVSADAGYRRNALARIEPLSRAVAPQRGAFMGYDFHVGGAGPRLIEINTNAGGAYLNALLARAQLACCELVAPLKRDLADGFESAVISMFESEWRLSRGDMPLQRIAIIDDEPTSQYLYPEFLLAQKIFERYGFEVIVSDPAALSYEGGALTCARRRIDLVYNRLTDFDLREPAHEALRRAWENDAVVVTPNPHTHAILADKRNLVTLTAPETLAAIGIKDEFSRALAAIPRAENVSGANADRLWATRKSLFFKPVSGYGGKAVYRGDKLTRAVWSNILASDYIAQDLADPGERCVMVEGSPVTRKVDVRLYTYDGQLLLPAARLYQGQTTNFRTPGGGFAPVFFV